MAGRLQREQVPHAWLLSSRELCIVQVLLGKKINLMNGKETDLCKTVLTLMGNKSFQMCRGVE